MIRLRGHGPPLLAAVLFTLQLGIAPALLGQEDSTLIRVRQAGVDSATFAGRSLYFSPGAEERARALASLLGEADRYLEDELGVTVDFRLAVLDEASWSRVWPFPYGVSYTSLAAPWVVVMPRSPDAAVMAGDLAALLGENDARVAVDNIGFHEVGHVYTSEYVYEPGFSDAPPVRWLDEFLASYLALAFLREVAPERATVWEKFADGVLAGPKPRFRTLPAFEDEYYGYLGSGEGRENYNWYQASFLDLAMRIHEDEGIRFLADLRDELRKVPMAGWTFDRVAAAMERATPRFRPWAEALATDADIGPDQAWPGVTWPVSTPEAENVNGAVLDSLDAEIRAGEFGRIDHFLVIRHGKLIYDRHYERDYAALAVADGRDTTHHIYNYDDPRWHPWYEGTDLHTLQSVTKSITSLALGIAVDEGHIDGVAVPAMSFFEAYEPDMSDPRRQAMTLQDLLTMRSGIDWNEQLPYDDPENTCIQMEASDDWIRFVLDRPMREQPGTRFDYNSGVSVLLGKIVGVATGTRVDRWTAERLFTPLGIRDWYWKITPDGEVDTEGGLYLRPHDLARVAYLVLRNGRWGDRQVVSEAWIRESTRPWVRFPDARYGTPTGYGYQWWLDLLDGEPLAITGSGFGGQYPVVVPEKDLVVVFNAWNNHDRPPRSSLEAILTRILPAAR